MAARYSKRIADIKLVLEMQGQDGAWNESPYQLGFYNGLELALSLLEQRDPKYRRVPKKWTIDIEEEIDEGRTDDLS